MMLAASGSFLVVDENGGTYGPFYTDEDAQYELETLRQQGIQALALECLGNNNY